MVLKFAENECGPHTSSPASGDQAHVRAGVLHQQYNRRSCQPTSRRSNVPAAAAIDRPFGRRRAAAICRVTSRSWWRGIGGRMPFWCGLPLHNWRFLMMRKTLLATAGLALSALVLQNPAQAEVTVKTGLLTCHVSSGWGFVFGATRDLNCTYTSVDGKKIGKYKGTISKFGIDVGYLQSGVLAWAVLSPSKDLEPGALAGDYGGLTAGATAGVGGGANLLIGGSTKTISLQPLSVEGTQGFNLAA